MTDEEKVLSLVSKSVVYNELWSQIKHIPDRRVMKEAALRVVMEIRPKDIEKSRTKKRKGRSRMSGRRSTVPWLCTTSMRNAAMSTAG